MRYKCLDCLIESDCENKREYCPDCVRKRIKARQKRWYRQKYPERAIAADLRKQESERKRKEAEEKRRAREAKKALIAADPKAYRNAKERERRRKRYLSDPSFRLKQNVSRRIRQEFQKIRANKAGKSVKNFLPYTFDELKAHIESQFEPWMNWDNWGAYDVNTWDDNDSSTWKWNLDHIKPHCYFNYTSLDEPDFKECWALENLRPYSAKLNILEGNRKKNDPSKTHFRTMANRRRSSN